MASTIILTEDEIIEKMKIASINADTPQAIESFIDHLVDLTIIGREVKEGIFEYEYDVDKSKKIKKIAQKLNSKRFRIHNALVPYLECVVT